MRRRYQFKLLLVMVIAALAAFLFSLRLDDSLRQIWDHNQLSEDQSNLQPALQLLVNHQNQNQTAATAAATALNAPRREEGEQKRRQPQPQPRPQPQQDGNISICFITSIFGKWAANADRLQNVTKLPFYRSTSFHFYAYTNLPRLKDFGWTKIVQQNSQYRRFITQSRWPKFLAWKEPRIQKTCEVVFYVDSIGELYASSEEYQEVARNILDSPVGLAQYRHRGGGGAFGEFHRVLYFEKDLKSNVQASKEWLLAQPDFNPNCTLYENRYMGYAVNSSTGMFPTASQFLWDHYSLEKDSWRDQPLWCYVLDRYNITPIPLDHKKLFRLAVRRMGKQKHKYGEHTDGDAQHAREQKERIDD